MKPCQLYKTFAIFLIVLIHGTSSGRVLSGFIVNEFGDTINGIAKLRRFPQEPGLVISFSPSFKTLYTNLIFKKDSESRYSIINPDEVLGFGLTFRGHEYFYYSHQLDRVQPFGRVVRQDVFLQLIYQKGDLKLYRYGRMEAEDQYVRADNKYRNPEYVEYYISNTDMPLKRVHSCDQYMTLKDCLRYYGVAEEFIWTLPDNLSYLQVFECLKRYTKWLNEN